MGWVGDQESVCKKTDQLLGSLDSCVVDGPGGDLVEGDDGVAALQLPLLQQLLARHLRVHHHVVQLGEGHRHITGMKTAAFGQIKLRKNASHS